MPIVARGVNPMEVVVPGTRTSRQSRAEPQSMAEIALSYLKVLEGQRVDGDPRAFGAREGGPWGVLWLAEIQDPEAHIPEGRTRSMGEPGSESRSHGTIERPSQNTSIREKVYCGGWG